MSKDDSNSEWRERLQKYSNRLPDAPQDEYYHSEAARLDTIIGNDKTISLWLKIRKARSEFDGEKLDTSFFKWLIEKYGIKLRIGDGDTIDLNCDIVDEKKYMLFLLKFSGE